MATYEFATPNRSSPWQKARGFHHTREAIFFTQLINRFIQSLPLYLQIRLNEQVELLTGVQRQIAIIDADISDALALPLARRSLE